MSNIDTDYTSNNFIHLRAKTSYSLLNGSIHPDQLVKLCNKNNMPAVAIADNNLFASLEFSMNATKNSVQPIIGCVFAFYNNLEQGSKVNSLNNHHSKNANFYELFLIAKNEIGYKNLLQLSNLNYSKLSNENGEPHLSYDDIKNYNEGIIALTSGIRGSLGNLLINNQLDAAEKFLIELKNIYQDDLYIELTRHGLDSEKKLEPLFLDLAYQLDIPIVATNDIYFASKKEFKAHDVLLCIAEGRYLVEEDRIKATENNYFKSSNEMQKLFADLPEALENTVNIAKKCHIFSPIREPILPHMSSNNDVSEAEELEKLAKDGLEDKLTQQIYPRIQKKLAAKNDIADDNSGDHADDKENDYNAEFAKEKERIRKIYYDRLQYELDIIIKMQFPGYFLIVSDFIRYSKKQNIPVGPGRGSGAGSLVAWVIEITDLDPIDFGLLFERFLNPERVSMPDFDIDFCQYRRDEVIKYVQQKFGDNQVAQIITFGKLQARAVLRDVGRVMQIPYGQVDKICKLIPNNPAKPVTLQQAIDIEPELKRHSKEDIQIKTLLDYGLKLEGMNRHASTHAAGVVIADRDLSELVPVYRDSRSEMLITQYSMKYAEMSGLVKFDFLGLKTLTIIQQTCDLINNNDQNIIDINHIPLDDLKTYEMLAIGDAIGVFQLESAGMQDTLKKMDVDRLEDIIALISLYRPGPMENIPTYIACKKGEQEPDYLHPLIKDILTETYGVIIYQEQVMQIAQILAGYSLGQADLLRRAMGKKIKAEMDKQKEIFISGALKNDVEEDQASYIFDLVEKFAGYGFNKSHAAAYGLISYQTAYLKANHRVEFIIANMNLDIHDTDKLYLFFRQAKNANIVVLPPDINKSSAYFTIEILSNDSTSTATDTDIKSTTDKQKAIRYGLGAIKNVGINAIEEICNERSNNGEFKNIFDLFERIDHKHINKRQFENMVKAGAMDSLYANRAELCLNIELLLKYNIAIMNDKASNQVSLFDNVTFEKANYPTLASHNAWNNKEELANEFDAIGYFFSKHPLDDYQFLLTNNNIASS
ncbi:MAG: DNA polymerase III subunit alpha, partial [Pseudomonadota bacterium]